MPTYRLASLSADQMVALERVEHSLGITLVAYEPADTTQRNSATARLDQDAEEDLVLDALVDTYRSYDPEREP